MANFWKTSVFFFLVLFGGGCQRGVDLQPELKDPIYQDLSARYKRHKKEYEENKEQLEDTKRKLDQPGLGFLRRNTLEKDERIYEAKTLSAYQLYKYVGIRAKKRKRWARQRYLRAYKNKKPWPPEVDFSSYEAEIERKEAELQNTRIRSVEGM